MSGRPKVPPLISVSGLARRRGVEPQWIRTLMAQKGAPEAVDVEGLSAAVYVTKEALAYLEGKKKLAN